MKINLQKIKLKNKQLIKKNNDLKNEIKILRKKFFSKFENDEENNSMKLERNIKIHRSFKYTLKYLDFFIFIDDKNFIYEN